MAEFATSVADDRAGVGAATAAAIVSALQRADDSGRPCLLGWPVGRTPRPIVQALVTTAAATTLDLSRLCVVLMDDYVHRTDDGQWRRVDETSAHSCRGSALRELVAPLAAVLPAQRRLDPANVWSPDPRDPGAYDERIGASGGIDLFVVALGSSDGHVALNPPGSARDSRTRVIELAESTRRDNMRTFPSLTTLADVPTHGVSVGLATIADARALAVVAHGPEKAAALARVLDAERFDDRFPVTIVVEHPHARLYCDRDALGDHDRPGPASAVIAR